MAPSLNSLLPTSRALFLLQSPSIQRTQPQTFPLMSTKMEKRLGLQGTLSAMAQQVKNLPAMQETQETWVQFLCREDPLEKEMATHSSILACEIPWTEEEPGGLQSIGLQESDTTGRLNHHHGNLHPKTFSKMFRITLRKAVLIDTATSQHPLGIFIFKQTRASTSGRMHTTCDGTGGFCLLSGHRHTLGWPPGDTTAQPASVQGGEGMVIRFQQSRG